MPLSTFSWAVCRIEWMDLHIAVHRIHLIQQVIGIIQVLGCLVTLLLDMHCPSTIRYILGQCGKFQSGGTAFKALCPLGQCAVQGAQIIAADRTLCNSHRCSPPLSERYRPTSPVLLISTSRASSMAVIRREAADSDFWYSMTFATSSSTTTPETWSRLSWRLLDTVEAAVWRFSAKLTSSARVDT